MKEQLIDFLNGRISECDSSASELFLEKNNPEDGNKLLTMSTAFKEVLEFVKTLEPWKRSYLYQSRP